MSSFLALIPDARLVELTRSSSVCSAFATKLLETLEEHSDYYDRAYKALHEELLAVQVEESLLEHVKEIALLSLPSISDRGSATHVPSSSLLRKCAITFDTRSKRWNRSNSKKLRRREPGASHSTWLLPLPTRVSTPIPTPTVPVVRSSSLSPLIFTSPIRSSEPSRFLDESNFTARAQPRSFPRTLWQTRPVMTFLFPS